MKTIKYFFLFIAIIFFSINFQSCKRLIWGSSKYAEQKGYVTDTLGKGISGVKMKILKSEHYFGETEETDYVFYTDENGFYDISIDNDYIYYIDLTHPDYIYPVKGNNFPYPQLHRGEYYEEINYQMVKKGPVKIKGVVRYVSPDLTTTTWLEGVKISVLKRPLGNNAYPDTTGIFTFSDENGKYYIEYEGDENFEFFLKPEKDGYYYDYYGIDYVNSPNYDLGYIDKQGFEMKKIGE